MSPMIMDLSFEEVNIYNFGDVGYNAFKKRYYSVRTTNSQKKIAAKCENVWFYVHLGIFYGLRPRIKTRH